MSVHSVGGACGIIFARDFSGEGPSLYEVCRVGPHRLLGEVIEIRYDRTKVQMYDSVVQVRVGDAVDLTGEPLCMELGPGLLHQVLDAVHGPLGRINATTRSRHMPRGLYLPELPHEVLWCFETAEGLGSGDEVIAGDVIGFVQENSLLQHKIMVPPNVAGVVRSMVGSGLYSVDQVLLTVQIWGSGALEEVTMLQRWPVRKAREVHEKITPDARLVSGIRAFDAFYPMVVGGSCAIIGGSCTGKTSIAQAITKGPRADDGGYDAVVHVNCGERGNEVLQLATDLESATIRNVHCVRPDRSKVHAICLGTCDPSSPLYILKGNCHIIQLIFSLAEESLMARTVMFSCTADMPLAGRELAVMKGMCVAEYLRDLGCSVALVVDSLTRWAECVEQACDLSHAMTHSSFYDRYPNLGMGSLNLRLATLIERGGRAQCLGRPLREGAITFFGTVSPPGGACADDPVSTAMFGLVQAVWVLEKRSTPQRGHCGFPSVNSQSSFSKYVGLRMPVASDDLILWALNLRSRNAELQEIVQVAGVDCLDEDNVLLLDACRLLDCYFLEQDFTSSIDQFCTWERSMGILRCIKAFHEVSSHLLPSCRHLQIVAELTVRVGEILRMLATPHTCSNAHLGMTVSRSIGMIKDIAHGIKNGIQTSDPTMHGEGCRKGIFDV